MNLTHALYHLSHALADEYARELRALYPRQSDYIEARYTGRGVPARVESIHRRAVAAFNAWAVCGQTKLRDDIDATYDIDGRAIAPPQPTTPARPAGPWDFNEGA